MYTNEPHPPEGSGQGRRRSLFGSGRAAAPAPVPAPNDAQISDSLYGYQQALEQRLDEGLQAIQTSAAALMREIAAEMWRHGGGDVTEAQDRILEFVSRDQSVRSVLQHSDERFQQLAVRTDRLEDLLREMTVSNQQLRDVLDASVRALKQASAESAAAGVDDVRQQLTVVQEHVDETMAYISERDRAMVEGIQNHVRDHSQMVSTETGRVVEAMQTYMKDGVDTMGRLAQHVELQTQTAIGRDGEMETRITEQLISTIGEQLQLLYDRLGIEARTLAQTLSTRDDGMGEELTRVLEARVMGLAQLVRSDSEALRRRLVETTAAQDEAMARLLDERLVRVLEAVTAGTRWTVQEMVRQIEETTSTALTGRVDELSGRIDDVSRTIDRNMMRLSETIDAELGKVGQLAGQRAAEAAGAAISGHIDTTAEQLRASAAAMEASRVELERMQGETETMIATHLDQRIGGLAKMVRSDNQILADRVSELAERDGDKQTLRAVKELQAGLANEVLTAMDRKFSIMSDQIHQETHSMAESFAKSADVLSRKIDRIEEETDKADDVQVVIERMGDAMHALAAMGRPQPQQPNGDETG